MTELRKLTSAELAEANSQMGKYGPIGYVAHVDTPDGVIWEAFAETQEQIAEHVATFYDWEGLPETHPVTITGVHSYPDWYLSNLAREAMEQTR